MGYQEAANDWAVSKENQLQGLAKRAESESSMRRRQRRNKGRTSGPLVAVLWEYYPSKI